VLTGTVDEVRKLVRFAKFLRIRGLEIVGYERPENPSCAFISQLQKLQYVRLFAGALKDIESVQTLPRLRYLAILYTTKHQPITIDFASLSALERVELQWFKGAEAIFKARQIRSLHLLDRQLPSSNLFAKLDRLISLRLSGGNLIDTRGFSHLSSLRWLGLLNQRELRDFGGLSGLASLRFLWIEACPSLKNIEWLAGMRQLETLRIIDCGEITSIEVLRSLPRLRHVHIHGSTRVASGDFAFLRSLPNLDSVVVKHLPEGEVAYWAQRNKRYNLLRSDLLGG
jgi:Leucine-rich repeat (LRR) protein